MCEEWREVRGFPCYEVSDEGRVRNTRSGRVLAKRPNKKQKGYLQVLIRDDKGVVRSPLVHHLVVRAFIGPIPPDLEVNHKDGDKLNNRLDNLEFMTRLENAQHALHVLGTYGRKLDWQRVRAIRRRLDDGVNARAIAAEEGVSPRMIHKIKRNKAWKEAAASA